MSQPTSLVCYCGAIVALANVTEHLIHCAVRAENSPLSNLSRYLDETSTLEQLKLYLQELQAEFQVVQTNIQTKEALAKAALAVVRCPRHSSEEVRAYCVRHMEVICILCGHAGTDVGCIAKDFREDKIEIRTAILHEIGRKSQYLLYAGPEVKLAIEKRFKSKIGQNLELLEKLKESEKLVQSLSCTGCQNVADSYVDIATFEMYCINCGIYNTNTGNWVEIGGMSNWEVGQLLVSKVPTLLKNVNFRRLSLDLLNQIEKRTSLNPKEIHRLCKDLVDLDHSKPNYSALPDNFLCPGCKAPQHKSTSNMFILPCPTLHALCEACVGEAGTVLITCPLDGIEYNTRPEMLKRLIEPVLPQREMRNGPPGSWGPAQPVEPDFEVMQQYQPQGPAQSDEPEFEVMQQYQPQGSYPGPAMFAQGGASGLPAYEHFPPVSPPSDRIHGIALPKNQIDRNLHNVVKFTTVLPKPGSADKNNKGYFYDFSRNQVEAVTIFTFDTCRLVAVGMANPTSPEHMAVVEYVCLYDGTAATGNPTAVHQGNELLQGGDQPLTYINLPESFIIPQTSKVTLKIKLVAPPSYIPIIGFELYRGNPFDRPDVWEGSDGLIWEFDKTLKLGNGETANGFNNLGGPILSFIYHR